MGGNRAGKKIWETAWAAHDSRQARAGNKAASQGSAEKREITKRLGVSRTAVIRLLRQAPLAP